MKKSTILGNSCQGEGKHPTRNLINSFVKGKMSADTSHMFNKASITIIPVNTGHLNLSGKGKPSNRSVKGRSMLSISSLAAFFSSLLANWWVCYAYFFLRSSISTLTWFSWILQEPSWRVLSDYNLLGYDLLGEFSWRVLSGRPPWTTLSSTYWSGLTWRLPLWIHARLSLSHLSSHSQSLCLDLKRLRS